MNAEPQRFVFDRGGQAPRWSNMFELIELAKHLDMPEWTAERRENLYRRVLLRAAKERARRRTVGVVAAMASALLLVGLVVKATRFES